MLRYQSVQHRHNVFCAQALPDFDGKCFTAEYIDDRQGPQAGAIGQLIGLTLYGWDGDTLAWESGNARADGRARTTHYVYEPGSFVPLAQAGRAGTITLHAQAVFEDAYDIDRDPLWTYEPQAPAGAEIAYYQCDHLGTPQELTDGRGEIAWSADYRARGAAKEAISEAARKAGIVNPLRFQGQYADDETGLHYNRYRYYDPETGRFISKDPIGLAGGLNAFQYAPNPVAWIDPLELSCVSAAKALQQLRGMSVTRIEKTLQRDGFTLTKDNGKNATWNHADGSEFTSTAIKIQAGTNPGTMLTYISKIHVRTS